MSVKKFKFVSPGVFLNEIDNSQIPKISDAVGPVLIGRSERGPALKPVRVESFSDFVEVFGAPIAGGQGNDVWRQGNGYLAPTYAAYAAQAYLRNSAPVTFIRLAGIEESGAVAGSNSIGNMGNAGWQGRNGHGSGTTPQAWGIFVGVQRAEPTATQVLKTTTGAAIAANATITIQKDSATPEAADPAVFKVVDRVSAFADQVVSVQPEEVNRIGKSFIVNVPSSTADALAEAAGEFTAGQGADITIKVVNNLSDPEPGNGEVHVLNAGGNNATGATNVRNRIRAAINGTDDGAFNVLHIKYGANTGPAAAAGDATGIRGITAVDSADANVDEKTLRIVAVSGGLPGNSIGVKRGAANNTDLVDADVTLSGGVGTDMTKAGTEADPYLIGMGGSTNTQKNNSVFTALAHASSIEAKIPTISATQSSNRLTMVRTYTTAVPKGAHNKTVTLSADSNITQEDAGGAADTTFASQVDSAKSALAAVIYPNSTSKEVEVCLSGIKAFGDDNDAVDGAALVASSAPKSHVAVLQSNDQLSTAQFTLHIRDDKAGSTSPEIKTAVVDFSPSSPNKFLDTSSTLSFTLYPSVIAVVNLSASPLTTSPIKVAIGEINLMNSAILGAKSTRSTINLPRSIVPIKFLIRSKNPILGTLIPLGIFIPFLFFFSPLFSFSLRLSFWAVLASNLIVSLLSFKVLPIIFSIFFVVTLIAATSSSSDGFVSPSSSGVGCFTSAPPAGFL